MLNAVFTSAMCTAVAVVISVNVNISNNNALHGECCGACVPEHQQCFKRIIIMTFAVDVDAGSPGYSRLSDN